MSKVEGQDSAGKLPPGENPFGEPKGALTPEQLDPQTSSGQAFDSQRTAWGLSLALVALFAIVNCAAVPISENFTGSLDDGWFVIVATGLGLIGGQIGLLSGLLVWSNYRFFLRLIGLWAMGLALFGCWFAGLRIASQDDDGISNMMYEVARAIVASLPLISLAIQLPQWALRLYLGWRIEPRNQNGSAQPRQALSIRDILIGTTIAALTIASVRFALDEASEMGTAFWAAWAMAVAVLVVVSAAVNIPLMLLILRGYHPALAILFILLGSPALVGALIVAIMLIEGRGGPDTFALAMMLIAGTSCVATTSALFWLQRLFGNRLELGHEA